MRRAFPRPPSPCMHPPGRHNHSGNIHVHIVINSLRIEEVPFCPTWTGQPTRKPVASTAVPTRPCATSNPKSWRCATGRGFTQIDLLNGSKNRVTDREYWAQKKGQAALDKQNASMIAGGITPRQTKFETNKEKLRQTIRAALSAATSFENFSLSAAAGGVAVKESRGRLSYLSQTGQSPLPPVSWAMILTAPLSLPFWSRTPPEPQKRPQPYPNTHAWENRHTARKSPSIRPETGRCAASCGH